MTGILISAALTFFQAFEYHSGGATVPFPYPLAAQEFRFNGEITNPALIPWSKGMRIHLTCGRPWYGSEIETASSNITYSHYPLGISADWNRFGTDFHREDRFSLSAGLGFFRFFSLGARGNIYRLTITDDDYSYEETCKDFDLSAALRPAKWLMLSAMKTNIKTFREEADTVQSFDCFGITLKPSELLSLSWNLSRNEDDRINTFTASAWPLKYIIIRGAYSKETFSFTSSITVLLKKFAVDYGMSHHEFLGYSHRLGITFNTAPPVMNVAVPEKRVKQSPPRLININTASEEELQKIPNVTDETARRIVFYREKFGPISMKALERIGFSEQDIREMLPCIFGLQKDRFMKSRKGRSKWNRKAWLMKMKRKVKILFRKMVARNVRASRALKYAELSVWSRKKIKRLFMEDKDLHQNEREVIAEFCIN